MTTRARSRSWPSAGVRLRGRADDRWTRCSELLVSSRKRSTRQPELSQAGPSDSQRGGRARAHLNTANCRAAARAPSVQTRRFECRPCYFPLLSDARTQIALWEKGCYVRGRSSGKTGPPGTTGFTVVRGGAIILGRRDQNDKCQLSANVGTVPDPEGEFKASALICEPFTTNPAHLSARTPPRRRRRRWGGRCARGDSGESLGAP